MCVQLHTDPLLVHPDANIYEQLQLALQEDGLVMEARFGDEAVQRGECFADLGMENGAVISITSWRIDNLSSFEDYAALESDLRDALEGVLQWYNGKT